jgi:hypothetical protein
LEGPTTYIIIQLIGAIVIGFAYPFLGMPMFYDGKFRLKNMFNLWITDLIWFQLLEAIWR